MTHASLAAAAATSLLSALQVPARGSRPPRPPRTRTSPHPFSVLPCVAAFACPSGTETRLADFAGKFSTGGETTLSAAPEGGDRVLRHNAVRNVVCFAVSEFTSVSPELEKPGLLLPPQAP